MDPRVTDFFDPSGLSAQKLAPDLMSADLQRFRQIAATVEARLEGLRAQRRTVLADSSRTGRAASDRDSQVHGLNGRIRVLETFGSQVCLGRMDPPAAMDAESAFVASLAASRSPRMPDVLATIQADQDAAYLAYTAEVLPDLGESGVQVATLADLVSEGIGAAEETDPVAERLKSDARMTGAVEPAVALYEEPPTEMLPLDTD